MKFYKTLVTLTFLIFLGCSKPNECPEFDFNNLERITTLNNVPYTGRCSTYINEKIKSVQQYLNGYDYGNWIFYFDNGQVETKGRFNKTGERVGRWKYYFDNGAKKQVSKYSKNGNRIGVWKVFNEDGDLIDFIDYGRD